MGRAIDGIPKEPTGHGANRARLPPMAVYALDSENFATIQGGKTTHLRERTEVGETLSYFSRFVPLLVGGGTALGIRFPPRLVSNFLM